jgi:hypothetical protein
MRRLVGEGIASHISWSNNGSSCWRLPVPAAAAFIEVVPRRPVSS